MNETYYILNPPERVRRLCAELLGEENFHQEIKVTRAHRTSEGSAWECTLLQLRQIHQTAITSGFSSDFDVVAKRRRSPTFRFVKKFEWHEGTIRQIRANATSKKKLIDLHPERQERQKRLKEKLGPGYGV